MIRSAQRAQDAALDAERRAPPSGENSQGTRALVFNAASYDAAARTVEAVLSAGSPVRRWSFTEELEISDQAIDLGRVTSGICRLLDSHNQWEMDAVLGSVTSARIENGQLIGVFTFADTDRGRTAEGMVSRGELTGVSIGYRVTQWVAVTVDDKGHETWRATRWELLEASLVAVPADASAGVRSAVSSPGADGANATPQEDDDMIRSRLLGGAAAAALAPETDTGARAAPTNPTEANAAAPTAAAESRADPAPAPANPTEANAVRFSAAEAIDFAAMGRSFGLEESQIRTWAETMTPDAARRAMLEAAGAQQRGEAPVTPAMSAARVSRDQRDTQRAAMANALQHRFNPAGVELEDSAREYRGMSLLEMARANLEANGERVRGLSRRELADMALSRQHTTSDFPNVLSNVTRATLRAGYTEAGQTFKRWQRRATVQDFRQVSRLQLGAAPNFLLVPEGGEFKMGTIGDGKEVYALATYGRKFAITRQTLINDDVDAFTRIPSLMGAAAARFESDAAYAPLIANPNMSDGVALFHGDHGNLGVGAAISEESLEAAEIAMGAQKGLQGEVLNLEPKYLIVARKDRVRAAKLLKAIQATATSDVNVYAGAFELIVESRLNRAAGATPWFMAADSGVIDTIEYAYLEGEDGVFLDEREGFDVDGIEYKARLDFGVKAIDFRGLYQNPGQ